jgi:hypothetical protein
MFKENAAPKRQGMSVMLQVSVPVRVPSTASFRRAMETAAADDRVEPSALLRRAWRVATGPEGRPTATRKDNLVTSLLSGQLVLGLFVDGWNHLNLQEGKLGPFLTPWHAGLYFGFTMTALWIITRCQRRGAWCLARVPGGYGSALVGMGISTVAMAGDAVWHTAFGVETGVARVISPFHLLLFIGALMLVTSSFRAAWSAKSPAPVETLRDFAPALLSIALAAAMVAFLFQFASPFVMWTSNSLVRLSAQSPFHDTMLIYGLLAVLVTNLILITPVLMILRRWEPPFGTVTFLFGVVALLSASMTNLAWAGAVAAAMAGGLIADLVIARLRPTPMRPAATRAAGAIIPVGLWGSHFTALHFGYGITWPAELWVGSIALASFAGLALSLLTVPARFPDSAWAGAELQAPPAAPAEREPDVIDEDEPRPSTAAYDLISAAQQWEAERAELVSASVAAPGAPTATDQTTSCHDCGAHGEIDPVGTMAAGRGLVVGPRAGRPSVPVPTRAAPVDDAGSKSGSDRNADLIALMRGLLDLDRARSLMAVRAEIDT